jgi:hypothetical protein
MELGVWSLGVWGFKDLGSGVYGSRSLGFGVYGVQLEVRGFKVIRYRVDGV